MPEWERSGREDAAIRPLEGVDQAGVNQRDKRVVMWIHSGTPWFQEDDEANAVFFGRDRIRSGRDCAAAARPPVQRWAEWASRYEREKIETLLGCGAYCAAYARDAARYWLWTMHKTVKDDEWELAGQSLAKLVSLVYYREKSLELEKAEGKTIDDILEVISTVMEKWPRWMKIDFIAKCLRTGSPIYVIVRLFNAFDSPSSPLPRALLQAAALAKDVHTLKPAREGYSVATRVCGWGRNRLANLGCARGQPVPDHSPHSLGRLDGERISAFSIGINHSLFMTEGRRLYVTGRLKNWSGDASDERIALQPVEMQLPQMSSCDKFATERVYLLARDHQSELIFGRVTSDGKRNNAIEEEWVRVVAGQGCTKHQPTVQERFQLRKLEPGHVLHAELAPQPAAGDRDERDRVVLQLQQAGVEVSLDREGTMRVREGSDKLWEQLVVCVGGVVHSPAAVRQVAFCDNGDVYGLLQIDQRARNYVLVKGKLRKMAVNDGEWMNSVKHRKERHYLVAEQVPGAEHATQFSVDRNGENLLFETREEPRRGSFKPPAGGIRNLYEDPEMCYGGAARDLELLRAERECGNAMLENEEESLIKLPGLEERCPRVFLSESMLEPNKNVVINEYKREVEEEEEEEYVVQEGDPPDTLPSMPRRGLKHVTDKVVASIIYDNAVKAASHYQSKGSTQLRVLRWYRSINWLPTGQMEDSTGEAHDAVCGLAHRIFAHLPNGYQIRISDRTEACLLVTVRPNVVFGPLEQEIKDRALKMLPVIYNGEQRFEIMANLWELHTPFFAHCLYHAMPESQAVECPFPEEVMRACERALLYPASTEGLTTVQLLNMLDAADYFCANLLMQDVIYRLLRNATRADINELLRELSLDSLRPALSTVLARFPHILLDWPIELDKETIYEASEKMQEWMGPLFRDSGLHGKPVAAHSNLSHFILVSSNCILAVGLNEIPLSHFASYNEAISWDSRSEETRLDMIGWADLQSLLYPPRKRSEEESAAMKRELRLLQQLQQTAAEREEGMLLGAPNRIARDLGPVLATIPPDFCSPVVQQPAAEQKHRHRRHRRRSGRVSELKDEERKEEETEERSSPEVPIGSPPTVSLGELSIGRREERQGTPKQQNVSFAEILKEEEERAQSGKKAQTPKRPEGNKRSKFRPLSFSEPDASPKTVDHKHDWTQIPKPAARTPKETKSLSEIMKEQSEKRTGTSRRRGPSVSGCQQEAAAIEALIEYYGAIIEDHQMVRVERCYGKNEMDQVPRWNADGDLYLD